ncbi:hypothetical protein ACT4MK_00410 (plasmid) [Bradyrhizobium barranii]|uniref:hypothetical protein n=2 Tax=Bradyrhizobium TaxID=374 RepID=UPI00139248EE|nr:hypothetical protein [Bradyrhizobium sp.]
MSRILISDVKAIDTRKARGGFFACHNTGVDRSYKDTMSDKLDFIKYLISTLAAASTKLLAATPANADTAGRLNQIVRTADDNVSDGHWARIAPLYEPLAPKLELAVMHVNADIIAGQKPAPDFHTYFALLAAEVQN